MCIRDRRVGTALEAVYPHHLAEHLAELAYHFSQARSGTAVEKGVDYCLRAGETARDFYANEAAIQHLTAALELLEGLPEMRLILRQRWEVVKNLCKAYLDCRTFDRARDTVRDYLAVAQRANYPWGMAAAHCWMARTLTWCAWVAGAVGEESSRRLCKEHLEKSLRIAAQHGLTDWQGRARAGLASLLSPAELPQAEVLLRETLQAPEGLPREEVQEIYGMLMEVCAWQGKWEEVAAALRQSIPLGEPIRLVFCLGTMEEALDRAGKQAEFIAFCEEAKVLYAQAGIPLTLNQWYLQPATPSAAFRQLLFRDEFEAPELRAEWHWHDPVQASAYNLSERPGSLTLRAGRGVGLNPSVNLNAPRMLLEVRGDFALETKFMGDWDGRSDEPGPCGLLVWKDVLNYVRLEKFSMGRRRHGSVQLEARIGGEYRVVGRGLLRGNSFHLRLERTGDRFATLCSTDGVHWLSCGQVVLPVKDPLWVGVAALHGMVVHFDYVQVLGRGQERSDARGRAQ